MNQLMSRPCYPAGCITFFLDILLANTTVLLNRKKISSLILFICSILWMSQVHQLVDELPFMHAVS